MRWEFMRLIYCGICVTATVGFMFLFDNFPTDVIPVRGAPSTSSWAKYIVAGVIANVCFLAGPVVDTYVSWLGFKSKWFSIALFGVGTTFTVVAAFLAVAGFFN